jgi:hypothetical protein
VKSFYLEEEKHKEVIADDKWCIHFKLRMSQQKKLNAQKVQEVALV